MAKKDITKIFIDEIYSTPPKKNYETNKIIYNQIDEIWSFDLLDMVDYKTLNNKGYTIIFIIIDNMSEYLWAKPFKNKYSKTITDEFSKMLSSSKRSPVKIESHRGTDFFIVFFRTS